MKLVVRILIFTVLIPGTVLVYIPLWILRHRPPATSPAAGILRGLGIPFGLPLLAIGVFVYAVCAWDFGARGQGTPGPYDPPRKLVRNRLYSRVRNPMYIGVTTVLVGEVLVFASRTLAEYTCVIFAACYLFVLTFEEPYLRRKFGASYQEYCRQTPRWIPRFSRNPADSAEAR